MQLPPCCTRSAVKSALNLMVLKGFVLIAFWVYLLGVCVDPVAVCWRAALPAAQRNENNRDGETVKMSQRLKRARIIL